MNRLHAWIDRHTTAILVVIICGGLALAFRADHLDRVHREEDRIAAARAYTTILRQGCEDRNQRDARILAGVKYIANDLDADPATVKPLSDALATRDCVRIYPMPTRTGLPVKASVTTTTLDPAPFETCEAAAAAGLVPLERGDPGYSPSLDADGDGIACE